MCQNFILLTVEDIFLIPVCWCSVPSIFRGHTKPEFGPVEAVVHIYEWFALKWLKVHLPYHLGIPVPEPSQSIVLK